MKKEQWAFLVTLHKEEIRRLIVRFLNCSDTPFLDAVQKGDIETLKDFVNRVFMEAPETGEIHLIPEWGIIARLQGKI